jgi:hypothetical protein
MKLFSKNQGEKKQFTTISRQNVLLLNELVIIRGGNAEDGIGITRK